MKFVSWNVNGLRAVVSKGFEQIFADFDADFFCLQEIKMQAGQLDLHFDGYEAYYNYAERKGYSGTAIFTRHKPLSVRLGIGKTPHDTEGRAITLEYPEFYLVNVYTPNSQQELTRLDYRMEWEDAFLEYVKSLDASRPVIICGDLNVAHEEIDLANPKTNHNSAGFTDDERRCMTRLLASGFTDTFRHRHPDATGAYSWWSFRGGARARNVGWRIDYFIVSQRIADRVSDASIHPEIAGADHCPVSIILGD